MDESKYGYWLPPDASAHGWQIDRLIGVLHVFMALLFFGWAGYLVYCLIKYRARPGHQATHALPQARFTTWAEGGVVAFELFLLAALSTPAWLAWKNARPDDAQALRVRVVAQQYAWNFHYPGMDGKFGKAAFANMSGDNPLGLLGTDAEGQDDLTTINQLHLPLGRPVILDIMSKDVIHGFNVPALRLKQDAIPGQSVSIWFTAVKPGVYEIACAQLCGLGHYKMRGVVTVESPEAFDAWVRENSPAASAPEPK